MKHTSKNNENPGDLIGIAGTNVILIGASGSGKSTVGFHLAQLLGFGLFDLDSAIERKSGKSIGQIFQAHGESGFRELESRVVVELEGIKNQVIVVGAGACVDEENFSRLKALGLMVWIEVDINENVRRLMADDKDLAKRPLLSEASALTDLTAREAYLTEKLQALYSLRLPFYQKADLHVACTYATSSACAQAIKSKLIDGEKPVTVLPLAD